MKKTIYTLCLCASFAFLHGAQNQTLLQAPPSTDTSPVVEKKSKDGIVMFTPPAGWQMADSNLLPKHVKVMVVGKGTSNFPPSMNLSLEPYSGTLKQYLKIIKKMNDAQGYEWKDLGIIKTEAGNASLSQVDTKSQWGDVRLMHVVLLENGTIYILTASALKQEFPQFYKSFFAAMRSLRIVNDTFEMISNPQLRNELKEATTQLQSQWKSLLIKRQQENPTMPLKELKETTFSNESFQEALWKPYKKMVHQKYGSQGQEWESLFLQNIEDQLLNTQI